MKIEPKKFSRTTEWILNKLSNPFEEFSLKGDMEEEYNEIAIRYGKRYALYWFWKQILISITPKILNSIIWSIIMLRNYIKVAFRNIFRQKGYSLINITGLAVGIASCILILLWVQDELSYDRYHENADFLYRVVEEQHYSGGKVFPVAVTPAPLAPALKEEFPEIINSMRYSRAPNLLVRYNDRIFYEPRVGMADPAIFEMFSFEFIKGDPKTALNSLYSVVITEDMVEKYFGSEDPIGKSFKIENRYDLLVTGVIKNVPGNSHLRYDMLVPFLILEATGRRMDRWGNNSYFTYCQLAENAKMEDVNEKIGGLIKKNMPQSVTTLYLQPLTKIHLHSDFAADIGGHGEIKYVYIFSLIAVFVLVIACINFMNLATARSGKRAREVGMRKVAGATRFDIIKQFLGESITLTLISLIVALGIVFLLLPSFNTLSGKEISMNILGSSNIFAGLLAITLFTGLIAGSYPAFFLSSFRPVRIVRGALKSGTKSINMRRVLVVLQFSLSIFLIIGTVIIHNQLNFIKNKEIGFDRERVVYMRFASQSSNYYENFKTELSRNSNIIGVSAANQLPTYIMNSTSGYGWEGKNPDDVILIHNTAVNYDYFKTLKMEFIEGRAFSKEFPTDENEGYIVNEEMTKLLGEGSAVGKILQRGDGPGKVIGVVKNFHFKSMSTQIEPMAIHFLKPGDFDLALIRIAGTDISENLKFIEETWNKVAPNYPFEYSFLDESFNRLYRGEQRMGTLSNFFSILAILIACLGLFGLASFMAEQRTREIGIRKVLGASISNIVLLLSREFILLVAVSNIIAWPVSYYFLNKWLQNYVYHAELGVMVFLVSAFTAILIALITVSFQAFKAASSDPVKSIRIE
ncbi:ABC transporter permease [candidate division KSB1 bacterium]